MKVKVTQSCPTLCDVMAYTVHGIIHARIMEWVAFPFPRGSSQPRNWSQVSCTAGRFLPVEPQGKPKNTGVGSLSLLQGIFPTQELNPGLRHCRWILYQLSYQEALSLTEILLLFNYFRGNKASCLSISALVSKCLGLKICYKRTSLVIQRLGLRASNIGNSDSIREVDPMSEKVMAPHSSTLAWKIPWTEEPGKLQSMGSLRVRHDWATSLSLFTFMHLRRKWQPTPVFLPGDSQGRGSLVGCRLWGRTRLKWLSSSSSRSHVPKPKKILHATTETWHRQINK